MKIWMPQAGHWVRGKSLVDALAVDWNARPVLAAVGGGGKTAALHQLAGELAARGKKVLLTTTTHMMMPDPPGLLTGDPGQIAEQLVVRRLAWLGQPASDSKMKGAPEALYQAMCALADVVLVEADGSRQLPLKLPASHEPVIPDNATHVLVLAGLSALGQLVQTVCHRPERVMQLLLEDSGLPVKAADLALASFSGCYTASGLGPGSDHRLDAADVARILRQGYWLPWVAAAASERTGTVVLNQADDEGRLASGQQIASLLAPIPCLITQLNDHAVK